MVRRWRRAAQVSLGIVACVMISLAEVRARASRLALYVAADGSDSWSGRQAAPDSRRHNGPFATLERARDAIRVAFHWS